jgi:hypothetical protein
MGNPVLDRSVFYGDAEIDRLADIHARLKKTSYWNNSDIGRIAVKINQIRYPELFR